MILDAPVDLRANARLLFTRHRDCVDWLVITAMLDAVSTMWFMFAVGPEIETNGLVRWLTAHLGFGVGPLLAKALQLTALWGLTLLAPRLARALCLLVIALNLFACLLTRWSS
jgi:hypothetical protein